MAHHSRIITLGLFFTIVTMDALEIRNRSAIKFVVTWMNAHNRHLETTSIKPTEKRWDPADRTVLNENDIDVTTPVTLTVIEGLKDPERCYISIKNNTSTPFMCALRNADNRFLVDGIGYLLAQDREIAAREQMALVDLTPFFAGNEKIAGSTITLTRKAS